MTIRLCLIMLLSFALIACDVGNSAKTPNYRAEVFNPKWMTGEYAEGSESFYLAGEQGAIAYSSDGVVWKSSDTPVTHTLRDISVNPSGSVMIAVGEGGTILRSTNRGETWGKAKLNLPEAADLAETRLNTSLYVESKKTWVAAGTQNAILYSSDDGLSWQLVSYNTTEEQAEILQLFIEEKTGDVFLGAQFGTTGRSTDGGFKWEFSQHDMQPSGSYIPHVVGFHQYDELLFAAADHGRLLVSDDSGKNWRLTRVPTAGYVTGSAYDPEHDVIALSTQMGDILVSKDKGQSWAPVPLKVNNWPSDDIPYLSSIIYDSKSKSLLVVGSSGVMARSSDGGATWFADVFKPLFNMSITTLMHSEAKNTFVAAGLGGTIATSNRLSISALPVENWMSVRPGIDQYIRKAIHIPGTDTFVAVGQLGGIWRSEDDGLSWSVIDVDYPFKNQPPHLRDIVLDKATGVLIAAGPAGSIIRSTDNGLSWVSVYQGEFSKGEAFTQILYSEDTNTYLAIEVLYRSVYESKDAGESWQKISTIESVNRNLWHSAISKANALMFTVGEKGGVAVSRDNGRTWLMADTHALNDLYGAYADSESNVLLAVGSHGKILRSEEGSTWAAAESATVNTLRRVVKEPRSGALLAFGQEGAIVRSTDRGKNWVNVSSPEYTGELRSALFESGSANVILVGRDGAILRSQDGGQSWVRLESGSTLHFRNAATNPETGTLIVVGQSLSRLSEVL